MRSVNQQPASEPPSDFLAAAYALDGPEANRALYAQWAKTYESQSAYVISFEVLAG